MVIQPEIQRNDVVWQNATLAQTFVQGVRGGIPYANDQIAIMLRMLKACGAPLESFVDLGCGSGILARAILGEYPHAQGVLVDFSEPMLDVARQDLITYPNLKFVQSDLATSEWSDALDGNVDAVVSGFAIHHLTHERKRALYAEIYARLNPDGFFINIEHVKSSTPWVEQQADEILLDSLNAFHQRQGTGKSREQVRVEFVHRPDKVANILGSLETQLQWLREIGYQDVDCYFKVFELAVFGGRRAPVG